jgi:hypothetical protein
MLILGPHTIWGSQGHQPHKQPAVNAGPIGLDSLSPQNAKGPALGPDGGSRGRVKWSQRCRRSRSVPGTTASSVGDVVASLQSGRLQWGADGRSDGHVWRDGRPVPRMRPSSGLLPQPHYGARNPGDVTSRPDCLCRIPADWHTTRRTERLIPRSRGKQVLLATPRMASRSPAWASRWSRPNVSRGLPAPPDQSPGFGFLVAS